MAEEVVYGALCKNVSQPLFLSALIRQNLLRNTQA